MLFREVNERIAEISGRFADSETPLDFLCECGRKACTAAISLTKTQYEAVRARPARFLVVHGHVDSDAERIVEQNDRYAVVEKVGAAAAEALLTDPRARRSEQAAST